MFLPQSCIHFLLHIHIRRPLDPHSRPTSPYYVCIGRLPDAHSLLVTCSYYVWIGRPPGDVCIFFMPISFLCTCCALLPATIDDLQLFVPCQEDYIFSATIQLGLMKINTSWRNRPYSHIARSSKRYKLDSYLLDTLMKVLMAISPTF